MDFRRKLRVPGEAEPGPAERKLRKERKSRVCYKFFSCNGEHGGVVSVTSWKETNAARYPRRRLRERRFTQPCRLEFRTFLRIEDAPRIPPSKLNVISDLYDSPIDGRRTVLLHRRSSMHENPFTARSSATSGNKFLIFLSCPSFLFAFACVCVYLHARCSKPEWKEGKKEEETNTIRLLLDGEAWMVLVQWF